MLTTAIITSINYLRYILLRPILRKQSIKFLILRKRTRVNAPQFRLEHSKKLLFKALITVLYHVSHFQKML